LKVGFGAPTRTHTAGQVLPVTIVRLGVSYHYLRITDRLKDLFIVGGSNAYSAEVERLSVRTRRSRRWPWWACSTSAWARSVVPSSRCGSAWRTPKRG